MQSFAEKIITALAINEVEFIVVGGISAVLQGVPVVTQDLDICYRRSDDNLSKLAEALSTLNPRLRGIPPELPNTFDERTLKLGTNFTLEVSGESLDLLAEMSVIGGYDDVVGRADKMEVAGNVVSVLSLEDLIKTKTAAGREKDLAVLPLLETTLRSKTDSENRNGAELGG